MSQTISPSQQRPYGLALVLRGLDRLLSKGALLKRGRQLKTSRMSEKKKLVTIEVPESWAGPMKKFLESVEASTPDTSGGRAVDFGAFERAVEKSAGELEKEAHRGLLQDLDIDAQQLRIRGKLHTRVGRYEGTYKAKTGEVRVMRSLYRENGVRNGKTVDPVSLRAGVIEEGWLPSTAQAIAFLLQQSPSREAVKAAEQLGRLPYSRSTFERVGHAVGALYDVVHAEVEDELIEQYQLPPEARSVTVGVDRVAVPMEEPAGESVVRNFRMAYVGTVTLNDGAGEALHTIRYGRMPAGDADALCQGLHADVIALLRKQPKLKVQSLVDGAAEMHALTAKALNEDTLPKRPFELVDFCHLVQKLSPAAEAIHGERGAEVLARWKLQLLNDEGTVWAIVTALRAADTDSMSAEATTAVHEAISYLENNGERMNYAEARRQGLPIGSGPTEATCKNLFEVRFRRCGSRWHDESGTHVVQLRALALSDRWDAGIALTLKTLRAPVRLAS